jgi:hypothetical protein
MSPAQGTVDLDEIERAAAREGRPEALGQTALELVAILKHARSRARDLGLCAVDLGLMEPCPRSGGCDQPTCMRCYPEPGDDRRPFGDIIRPAACGGVTIPSITRRARSRGSCRARGPRSF